MIGIMSGRLSSPINNRIQAFPVHNWRNEFKLAQQLGLECIEWIYEEESAAENPIMDDDGILEMKRLSETYGIRIPSMVADNFMFQRLYGESRTEIEQATERLGILIRQAHRAGMTLLELPLMGRASILEPDARSVAGENIKGFLDLAEELDVVIALELDLPPRDLLDLMQQMDHPNIGINYDTGNSAVFGFDPKEEMSTYGHHVVNVHIKDGVKGNGTVPLGTGHTDFPKVFEGLAKSGFSGDFILQAAREDLNENAFQRPINETIGRYLKFIHAYIDP